MASSFRFLWNAIETDDDSMVAFVWLKRELLLWLKVFLLELGHFPGEDGLRRGGGVNARRLDRDDKATAGLQEVLRVERNDTRLIGLCDVSEYAVNHAHEHAVLERMASIFDNWDDLQRRKDDARWRI